MAGKLHAQHRCVLYINLQPATALFALSGVARKHVPPCGRAELSEADVAAAVAERAAARAAKDFTAADAVRVRLAERGIMLMDSAAGTSWRPGVLEQSGG